MTVIPEAHREKGDTARYKDGHERDRLNHP